MNATRSIRALSALFALLVAVAIMPSASQAGANEQTDLQIQVIGLKSGSQRDVLIRVTNISVWWSDRTVATVQIVSPTAGQAQTFTIPDLNTLAEAPLPNVYEFTYTLPSDCNGQVVKATLSPGTNYAGVKETKLDNNTDQRQVCASTGTSTSSSPSTSSSSPASSSASLPAGATAVTLQPRQVTPGTSSTVTPDVTYNDGSATPATPSGLIGAPVMLDSAPALLDGRLAEGRLFDDDLTSPGAHTTTLPLSISMRRGADQTYHGGFHAAECYALTHSNLEPKFIVGWGEYQWYGSPCGAQTYQVAVSFGQGALAQVPDFIINRVVLAYDEVEMPVPFCNGVIPGLGLEDPDVSPNCWRSGGGKPEAKPNGCVVVRVPSAEWRNNEIAHGFVPFLADPRGPAVKQLSAREWDVTEPYQWQNVPGAKPILIRPGSGDTPVSAGFGFLLSGGLDLAHLDGDDSTSCISWVTNVHLNVSYTVPQDQGGFVPPR